MTNEQVTEAPEASNQKLAKVERPKIEAGSRGLVFGDLDSMWRFCVAVVNSGQFGKEINTPEVALIRLQAGLELGLSPIWSLTNILVVNGRPSVWGDAFLGLIQNHPDFQDMIETIEGSGDEMVAVCELHRRGRAPIVRRFGVNDAKRAGLWGKSGPWSNYSKRMLQMRARSWAGRDGFADVLRGLGVVEEMRDVPEREPVKALEKPAIILPDEADRPVVGVAGSIPSCDDGGSGSSPVPLNPIDKDELW